MHTRDKAHQPQVMIAMHVRYKHLMNALHFDFELAHLHLSAFTTINQKKLIMDIQHLCRRAVLSGWGSRAAS
jgi:hypothetical protein